MVKKRRQYSYQRRVSIKPGYRSQKRGRKLGKFFVYPIALAVIVFLVYAGGKKLVNYAYAADSMTIKDIEVVGCKNVTKTEIRELLPFNIGDNLLKINTSEAELEIMKVKPELRGISISRGWNKVRIKLYERTPEAFVVINKELNGIDFDNRPFPLRGFMSGMKIPVITCKTEEEREQILGFIKAFKNVSDDFIGNIAEIRYSNSGDIVFKTNNNALVYWGDERTEHMAHKFDKFRKIYADAVNKHSQIEYIDITFYDSGKAVVKPREVENIEAARI